MIVFIFFGRSTILNSKMNKTIRGKHIHIGKEGYSTRFQYFSAQLTCALKDFFALLAEIMFRYTHRKR